MPNKATTHLNLIQAENIQLYEIEKIKEYFYIVHILNKFIILFCIFLLIKYIINLFFSNNFRNFDFFSLNYNQIFIGLLFFTIKWGVIYYVNSELANFKSFFNFLQNLKN